MLCVCVCVCVCCVWPYTTIYKNTAEVCVSPLSRKSFEPDVQFVIMCRIVTDQTQPMNHKVKLAWLEYLRELLPLLDSAEFRDTTGMLPQ